MKRIMREDDKKERREVLSCWKKESLSRTEKENTILGKHEIY